MHLFSYVRSSVPPYLNPTSQILIKLGMLNLALNFAKTFEFTFNFYHIITYMETGFELIIGVTELQQLVTTSEHYAVTLLHTSHLTIGHSKYPQPVSLHWPLLGSGFQRRTLPFLWVLKLSSGSATSSLQQLLTITEPQLLSN
jgi:hypothetical protein